MALFRIAKILPATYTETVLVEAASQDEAFRFLKQGRFRCVQREFATTPDSGQGPATKFAISESKALPGDPAASPGESAFFNGVFTNKPGDDHQVATQKLT